LPTGGTLVEFIDPFKDVPSDCSRVFGFLPQVAAYLAGTNCLLKVLQVMSPLVDVVKALPASPTLAASVPKFLKATEALVPCLAAVSGLGAISFARDLVCLVIRAMNCIIGELKAVFALLKNLGNQLALAQTSGNSELADLLLGQQETLKSRTARLIASIRPIGEVLSLAGPILSLAGLAPVQLPAVGSQVDLDSLSQLLAKLQEFVSSLQATADALGGCAE
jgi:hypothetical protein